MQQINTDRYYDQFKLNYGGRVDPAQIPNGRPQATHPPATPYPRAGATTVQPESIYTHQVGPNRLGQQYDRYHGNTNYRAYNLNNLDPNYTETRNLDISQVNATTPLSLVAEPEVPYKTRTDFIVVASGDRDPVAFPSPSYYQVCLPSEFQNIISIEIINGVIPDQNNVRQEPYLLLKIDELNNDVMTSVNPVTNNSFALLHLSPPVQPGYFLNVDKKTFEHVILRYKTPKASLSKLTISITDIYGNLFNFGDDSGGPLKALQNMFVLKVVTLEKDRAQLNTRCVF